MAKCVYQKARMMAGNKVIINSRHACRAFLLSQAEYRKHYHGEGFSWTDQSDRTHCTDCTLCPLLEEEEERAEILHVPETGVWHILIFFDNTPSLSAPVKYSIAVD